MNEASAFRDEKRLGWPDRTDEQLLRLAQAGQTDAFAALTRRYESKLFNYLRRMTGNAADAEDLFQETFLRVYTHMETFREDGAFRPWVYRIATNICKDHQRSWRRRVGRFFRSAAAEDVELVASRAPGPSEKASEAESAERLAAAVGKLSMRHRAVFLMARYHGMSYEEISSALDIPVGTVKSRMNTAVNFLMNELGDE